MKRLLLTLLPAAAWAQDKPNVIWLMAANHALVLRTSKWKYIEPSKGAPMVTWGPRIETGYKAVPQLFRITSDHSEQVNRAECHPRVVRKLQHQIDLLRGPKP